LRNLLRILGITTRRKTKINNIITGCITKNAIQPIVFSKSGEFSAKYAII